MSLITRIFLAITILAGIGTIVMGIKLKKEKQEHIKKISDQTSSIKTLETNLANEKVEKDKKASELKKAQGELTDAQSEVQKSRDVVAAKEAKVKEVEGKLASANTALEKEKTKVKAVMSALPSGISPDQVAPKIKELQDKVAAFEQEKNVLSDQLKDLEFKRKTLEQAVRSKQTGELPDGIQGRVMAVNDDWNFVVLDIGEKQGLVQNARMVVYRGNNLIGRVKIASVEPTVAVADILPEWKQARIQEGDIVAPAR